MKYQIGCKFFSINQIYFKYLLNLPLIGCKKDSLLCYNQIQFNQFNFVKQIIVRIPLSFFILYQFIFLNSEQHFYMILQQKMTKFQIGSKSLLVQYLHNNLLEYPKMFQLLNKRLEEVRIYQIRCLNCIYFYLNIKQANVKSLLNYNQKIQIKFQNSGKYQSLMILSNFENSNLTFIFKKSLVIFRPYLLTVNKILYFKQPVKNYLCLIKQFLFKFIILISRQF
ncbi:transmembrane protein, putative (macronuclear) [Tetrahymena thermophila SB210]|uniref:Transmembrane protein, putative n=1 Tax=Tetrahymena thermophila (strain SB210) TaxID=312017 RepID=W7XBW7_TETTS|nr:transmembrane protein, putative [Tetrahymena thermophila SB210]EWS73938.1 transmembrane protein, putative [Tetrahymena thermophila SB210]|eukprot:XP_012653519.1 transmembrane protein, putative [Tetrahymena thermophila SB210]